MTDTTLDQQNAEFWNVLCGWAMAQDVGLTGDTAEDLRRFDDAYLTYYPYLEDYVSREPLKAEARAVAATGD